MKAYSATTQINATAETVWEILTDGAAYPAWDPAMISLEGTIAPGAQITIVTKLAPNRPFKPNVSTFDPPRHMVWSSGMPFGLFKGVRTFQIEAAGEGAVTFTLTEVFSGLMLPLFGASIPDMNPVFAEFCAALKARAEAV